MTPMKMNAETHSWVKYLSPNAKALLFAVPMIVGAQAVQAEETSGEKVRSGYEEVSHDVNARDEVSQEAKEQKRKLD